MIVVVLGAGLLHASWNAIAKYISDGLVAFALIGVASTLGGAAMLLVTGLPDGSGDPLCCDIGRRPHRLRARPHELVPPRSLQPDLPDREGTSPLVVAAGAYVFAHERPRGGALAGVAILAVGLMSLALSAGRLSRQDLPAVGAAVLTGLAIATYTLIDGLGVRHSHDPYAYGGLLFLIQGPVIPVVALARRPLCQLPFARRRRPRPRRRRALDRRLRRRSVGPDERAPLAEVAALRETSVIAAALIGTLLLKERFGARRAAAAVLVAAGIVLISV